LRPRNPPAKIGGGESVIKKEEGKKNGKQNVGRRRIGKNVGTGRARLKKQGGWDMVYKTDSSLMGVVTQVGK